MAAPVGSLRVGDKVEADYVVESRYKGKAILRHKWEPVFAEMVPEPEAEMKKDAWLDEMAKDAVDHKSCTRPPITYPAWHVFLKSNATCPCCKAICAPWLMSMRPTIFIHPLRQRPCRQPRI